MKLFGRSGGHYLFWTGFVYLALGTINIFVYSFTNTVYLQMAWIGMLLLPLTIPPVARFLNMSTFWEQTGMWRKKEIADKVAKDNIVPFPEPKLVPPMPKVSPPTDDSDSGEPCYQIGKTGDGRITMRMGNNHSWSQLTMNEEGVDTLIRMLEAAKEQ